MADIAIVANRGLVGPWTETGIMSRTYNANQRYVTGFPIFSYTAEVNLPGYACTHNIIPRVSLKLMAGCSYHSYIGC